MLEHFNLDTFDNHTHNLILVQIGSSAVAATHTLEIFHPHLGQLWLMNTSSSPLSTISLMG